jgi:hypothetical protein
VNKPKTRKKRSKVIRRCADTQLKEILKQWNLAKNAAYDALSSAQNLQQDLEEVRRDHESDEKYPFSKEKANQFFLWEELSDNLAYALEDFDEELIGMDDRISKSVDNCVKRLRRRAKGQKNPKPFIYSIPQSRFRL